MKSSLKWKEYQRLELIVPEQPTFKQRCQRFWQALVTELKGSSEPHLWQSRDRAGNLCWNGDDPISGRSVRGISETEMLTWLEQRHYGSSPISEPRLKASRRRDFEALL